MAAELVEAMVSRARVVLLLGEKRMGVCGEVQLNRSKTKVFLGF